MTRLGSRMGSIVVMLALSSSAWAAATVTVSGTTGPESAVGREGAWRAAVKGEAIGEKDFLKIPAGASVQVRLPDGTIAGFDGKIVVPGRRLVADKTSATHVARLARAIQNASDAVGGVAAAQHAPGAAKVENVGSRPESGFEGARANGLDSFGSDELDGGGGTLGVRSGSGGGSGAGGGSSGIGSGSKEKNVVSPGSPPPPPPPPPEQAAFGMSMETGSANADVAVTPSRADLLREGLAAEANGNFESARASLEKAAAAGNKKEGNVDAARAEASLALGRVHLQLGDVKAAKKALAEAAKLDTAKGKTGPHAARAHYLLGITALERGERKTANAHFAMLKGHPALEAAAQQAIAEPPR